MKKLSKLLIVAILAITCLLIVACGNVDSIYFETEPRNTYVQGQEFTLDNSVLMAMSGGKSEPIDAANVTVTGYNKDQLGEQTVTITYEEQTVTLKVTVIPQIALEGITRDYFIGDSFDKSKGRLRIADENANIKSVNMSEASVTVEGFDSSTEGTKTLTVKYGDYSSKFTVNVFVAETVELTATPKKDFYYSHDTEFSVAGAYFTVTANNGSLTRMIEATPDMVEGFRPSDATIENLDSDLKQVVKFNYLGKTFDFKITIRFSGVSLILLRSEELKGVDADSATAEQNEKALDALRKYVNLTPSDQKLIDKDLIQNLLNIGIPYGVKLFNDEAETFAETIKLQTVLDTETNRLNGKINIVASSYEAVKRDLARLEEDDVFFLNIASTLYELKEEFYRRKIGDKTVDEILCTVFDTKAIDEVTSAFDLLLDLHEILLPVPEDWTKETLKDYANEIRAAVATINASDYKAFDGSATLYSILSSWRGEKNDYFDIIYGYYYYFERDNLITALWEKVYLPGPLQDLFTMHNLACQEAMNIRSGDDTSTFIYYYSRANQIADTIKSSETDLRKNLYNFFNFDRLISAYLVFGTEKIQDMEINGIAYVYHASSLYGNVNYENLLADFFELFKLSLQDGFSFEGEEVQELASKILNSYVLFTPSERFAFLSSLHCDYRITTSTELVLKHTVEEDGILNCYSYFTYLLYSSYKEVLSEEAYNIFSRLMEASEMYALRYHNPNIYNGFTDANDVQHLGFMDTMAAIIEDASELDDSEKELFASLLSSLTESYNEIKEPSEPTINADQSALFDELKLAIENFYAFYNLAVSEDTDNEEQIKLYVIAFSAYERAKAIASELLATENEDVLYTLIYKQLEFNVAVDQNVGVMNSTYDYMLDSIGGVFYLTVLRTKIETHNACTVYLTYNIGNFLNLAYDVILAEYNNEIDESYKAAVLALMEEYASLTDNQIFALKLFGALDYYFSAIEHCLEDTYDEDTMAVVNLLCITEKAYANYVYDSKSQDNRTAFTTAFKALDNAYKNLENTDAFDEDFETIYFFYAAKYMLLM